MFLLEEQAMTRKLTDAAIVELLNRIATSNARNINPPATGSRREDYLEGQAADEIDRLTRKPVTREPTQVRNLTTLDEWKMACEYWDDECQKGARRDRAAVGVVAAYRGAKGSYREDGPRRPCRRGP